MRSSGPRGRCSRFGRAAMCSKSAARPLEHSATPLRMVWQSKAGPEPRISEERLEARTEERRTAQEETAAAEAAEAEEPSPEKARNVRRTLREEDLALRPVRTSFPTIQPMAA